MRSSVFVAVLTAGLSLGVGCKKAEDKSGAGSGSAPAAAGSGSAAAAPAGSGSAAPAAAPAAAIPQQTGDDLSLLPAKAELVMGINFQQMQGSALWKELVLPQLQKNMADIEKFKEKCGFNPLETIKSLAIGMNGIGGSTPDGAMVIHGLDKAKTLECMDKMKEDAASKGTEFTKDGDVVVMKDKNGMVSATQFVNDTTMLVAINGDKAKLAEYAKGGSSLKTSPAFVDMFGKINNQHTLWALMRGDSKAFEAAAQANIKFKAVYGSVNVTDSVTVAARARTDSADAASQLASMATKQLGQMKGFVDKLDITTDSADLKIDVVAGPEKLKTLMSMAGMSRGGDSGAAPEAPPAAP